jgi:methylthioribulose-1-phosphate dehydratase
MAMMADGLAAGGLASVAPAVPHELAEALVAAGRRMDQRGWVPATSGNLSARLAGAERMAITRSGVHKGFLAARDIIEVDFDGRCLTPGMKPSAETLLHCQIYRRFADAGAVLHGHSVAGTVLSIAESAPSLRITGYEVQKIFAGQTTHETVLHLPMFHNDQDIARLAGVVEPHLASAVLGYLIRGHGVYVWGPTMDMALARLEGLEFLLNCELERRRLQAK